MGQNQNGHFYLYKTYPVWFYTSLQPKLFVAFSAS